jgi:hypothetical protein
VNNNYFILADWVDKEWTSAAKLLARIPAKYVSNAKRKLDFQGSRAEYS